MVVFADDDARTAAVGISFDRDDTFAVMEDVFVVMDWSTAAELAGVIVFDELPIAIAGELRVYTVQRTYRRVRDSTLIISNHLKD